MNKDTLVALVDQRLTQRQIADKTGKSQTTIRYWLKKHDLQTKSLPAPGEAWDAETFATACAEETSIRGVLLRLGKKDVSNNYRYARRMAERLGVSLPSWVPTSPRLPGQGYRKTTEQVFVEDSTYTNGSNLKKRLINDFGWVDSCMVEGCPSPEPEWNGQRLTLQVDHINGIHVDNRIDNLRIICPNCHTQTETYGNGKRP